MALFSKLEKEKVALSVAKSSLEIENACLNKLVSEEGKKRARVEDQEELDHALAQSKHELSKSRGRLDSITQESIEAYKALEECTKAKRWYASEAYLFGRDDIKMKVALKYPQLKLNFLDVPSNKEEEP